MPSLPEEEQIEVEDLDDAEEGEEKIDISENTDDTGEAVTKKEADAPTTAKCDGDTFKYQPGKPIVSITFSLSSENPFEVNVGTGITNYKRSDKKASPVLCEVRDLTGESSDVKIVPLKNKACIEKNIPNVLAPVLTQLNALLLDQYTAYYDTKKYDAFVDEQDKFLKTPTKGSTPESEDTSTEEGAQVFVAEGTTLTPEQLNRSDKIQILIEQLKEKAGDNQIGSVDDANLPVITTTNGVNLPTLKAFLKRHEEEVFPLYLLPLQYGKQQIFMTKNGIVTNGSQIFSYNDITDKKIISLGLAESSLTDEKYEEAKNRYNGTNELTFYLNDEVLETGFKKSGGKRKTFSKKLLKRATRRNRK
jgi:hypothetical protein